MQNNAIIFDKLHEGFPQASTVLPILKYDHDICLFMFM